MNRRTIGIGLALILLGGGALLLGGGGAGGTGIAVLVGLLSIFGLVAALWKLLGGPDATDQSVLQPPWTEAGALFDRAPERTPNDDLLSGASFAAVLSDAGKAARAGDSIEDGFETVRPVLRHALVDALAFGEGSRGTVQQRVEAGDWTEDPIAAAVLSPAVELPALSFRQRLEAWLFPERFVRRQLQRTVQAIAEAADEAIPNVPGQNAPRSVPVQQPRLEDLQRGVDGRVQQAVDPLATARGPRPPGAEELSTAVESDGETESNDDRTASGDEPRTAPDRGDADGIDRARSAPSESDHALFASGVDRGDER